MLHNDPRRGEDSDFLAVGCFASLPRLTVQHSKASEHNWLGLVEESPPLWAHSSQAYGCTSCQAASKKCETLCMCRRYTNRLSSSNASNAYTGISPATTTDIVVAVIGTY